MKPLTLILTIGVVAFAASSFNKWAESNSRSIGQTAKDCAEARPFTRNDHTGSNTEQQRAMLKAAECAYGVVSPFGGAIMKQNGADPKEAIDLFRRMENEIPRE